MRELAGKVAVVAGATRGAGRGIAVELGVAGAAVYCTGRSTRGSPSDMDRPETIEETADLVTAHGGEGIPVRVDHTVEDDVRALFERIKKERNGLDVLVNDVWGGDPLTEWGTPFWSLSVDQGFQLLQRAVHSHILTSRYAVPLMLGRPGAIIMEITDGDGPAYRGNLFYDLAKSSVMRLAFAMAEELRERQVTAVALTPGFLRSEAVLDHFGVSETNWRTATHKDPYFAGSETPRYIGRAVTALASDPEVSERSGQTLATWHLAREYDFVDVDGRQPHWPEFLSQGQP